MVHVCTGCYFQALLNMPKERHVNIMMLPEFVDMLQKGLPKSIYIIRNWIFSSTG